MACCHGCFVCLVGLLWQDLANCWTFCRFLPTTARVNGWEGEIGWSGSEKGDEEGCLHAQEL